MNVKTNKNGFIRTLTSGLLVLAAISFISCQGNKEKAMEQSSEKPGVTYRFEHLAMNVADSKLVANWYKDNLDMKIIRQGGEPTFTTFIADSGKHMMYEFYHNIESKPFEPFNIDYISFHVASVAPSVKDIKDRLLAKGAVIANDIRKSDAGDVILVLRDPWGLPIQFIERAEPILKSKGYYFEHIAINVADSRAVAKWYIENMGMVSMRESGAPNYGFFLADAGKNMMLELYQNPKAPVVDFNTIDFLSLHLASMSSDMQATKENLVKAGAKVAQDINETPSGDFILVLRDPWGFPLQFVKRAEPMLK